MIAAFRPLVACYGALVCLLGGCATDSGPQLPGNRFMVSVKSAQFYKYGPAQAFGADFTLAQGQKLTMLDRQYGYSRVTLDDGTTGYVATDELTVAPPEPPPPKPAPSRGSAGGGWFSTGKPKRSNVLPTPSDPLFDVNDVPLPMPEEEPSITPQPASPEPKPDSN